MYKDFYNNKLVPFVNKVRMACNVGEIPLVFDNSLTYYEQIAAFSAKLNDVISTVNVQSLTLCEFMQQLTEAFKELSDDFAEKWSEIQSEFAVIGGKINGMKLDISDLDTRVTALEEQPDGGVGQQIPEGTQYEYDDKTYTAGTNCEIFGCYETQGDHKKNEAAGNYSHAEGSGCKAYASESHAEGYDTLVTGREGHAEGYSTLASGRDAHAEGHQAIAEGWHSHAEGDGAHALGLGSHAGGKDTVASGNYSHAEGSQTIAGGTSSHAEGAGCTASADYSHAGGAGCTASGSCSFVHGMSSNASGNNSGAIGADLIANGNDQFVCGHANEEKNSDYLFIVGNGVTGSARSNAFEVDKYGNIYLNGSTKPFKGVTVYDNSEYTIAANTTGAINVNNLNATADGYLIGSLQTVHISGSYDIYYSVSSDTGYKICDITVPGTITDPEKEIAVTTNFDNYLSSGTNYNFYVAKIETVDSIKKLAIYFKSMGRSHDSSGQSFTFDITATFKVS